MTVSSSDADEPSLSLVSQDDPFFEELLDVRYKLLRKPLGMALGSERNKLDQSSIHLALMRNSKVVACVSLCCKGEYCGKVFQMAVDRDLQNKGFGLKLMRGLVDHAKSNDIKSLWLNARSEAMRFYERAGFSETGAFFIEVGVIHKRMELNLD
ncbi:hypothetical protein GEMRC1_002640 [Eukaryota sp. GEM-RC1]